jgi:hypothetical protein
MQTKNNLSLEKMIKEVKSLKVIVDENNKKLKKILKRNNVVLGK